LCQNPKNQYNTPAKNKQNKNSSTNKYKKEEEEQNGKTIYEKLI
jgi:hypothetical protein